MTKRGSANGEMAGLAAVFSKAVLGGFSGDAQAQADVGAYVISFDTGAAPAVGFTLTVTSANVTDPFIHADWATLQGQAVVNNIDLVVKGTVSGVFHGFVFQPATNTYQMDVASAPPYSQAQLIALIGNGDTMSFMSVPPGSGVRMGVDRNLDGIFDGDQ